MPRDNCDYLTRYIRKKSLWTGSRRSRVSSNGTTPRSAAFLTWSAIVSTRKRTSVPIRPDASRLQRFTNSAGARAVSASSSGRVKVTCVSRNDVADLHRDRANENALFQVASQFNLLEMASPSVTPEHGVTRYQGDHTQGPACAIAAGAATIYRNYFAEIAGQRGQTRGNQIDCLADLGSALGNEGSILWRMRNGYALCDARSVDAVDRKLKAMGETERDALRGLLRIGLHWNVEVTASPRPYPRVSQAFCSALPVAYWDDMPKARAEAFAVLVLEGAYEATLLAAILNMAEFSSPIVYLTRVGGGAFGNDDAWIDSALRRALNRVRDVALDVRLVSYGDTPKEFLRLQHEYAER